MNDDLSPLLQVLPAIPIEVERYFEKVRSGAYSGRTQLGLNLLPPAEVAQLTATFREFHPLIQQTGAIILDDADTSDYHCYVPDLPIAGSVLHLRHDGESRIVFASLSDFVQAADRCLVGDNDLGDYHLPFTPLATDQERLSEKIATFYHQQDEDVEASILLLVESSSLSDDALFIEIAADSNFYFGEAIANTILVRPRASLLELAKVCSQHPHPQVSRPGAKALSAVQGLQ
ncbi:hypothetical protein [Aeoliella sp. SH292]|uniref:hypothetical protein n=1 Tax=Aeoliella sp. SH292 TaxID=3454464 RepID=UPI003F9A2C3B